MLHIDHIEINMVWPFKCTEWEIFVQKSEKKKKRHLKEENFLHKNFICRKIQHYSYGSFGRTSKIKLLTHDNFVYGNTVTM
jgi:hypothetical protein